MRFLRRVRRVRRFIIAVAVIVATIAGFAGLKSVTQIAYARPFEIVRAAGLNGYTPYTVKQGDNLWTIAKSFCPATVDIRDYVAATERINKVIDLIREGQVILLPTAE